MKNLAYQLLLPIFLTLAAVQSVSFSFKGGHEMMACRTGGLLLQAVSGLLFISQSLIVG